MRSTFRSKQRCRLLTAALTLAVAAVGAPSCSPSSPATPGIHGSLQPSASGSIPTLDDAAVGASPETGGPVSAEGGASNEDAGSVYAPPTAAPYEPVTPASYVPKVKNLLTGLAATDAEVKAVAADPTALRGLIDQWMALPTFQGRMLDFFRNAFQQNQVTLPVLLENIGVNVQVNEQYTTHLERSIMDSFPLTVWELIKEGQPLNTALTTNRYMLPTTLMSLMSLADELNVADTGKTLNRLDARKALTRVTLDPSSNATMAQSLDATGTSFMTWNLPINDPKCMLDGGTVMPPVTLTGSGLYLTFFDFLMGRLGYPACGNNVTERFAPQFADADFADYRMVTLHTTDATTPNTTPVFYDIPSLRAATDLTLHTQRIGFFGTLAFSANWATNLSNEMRVTANQSLIVGIGQSINGESTIIHFPVNSADADHATNAACAVCHSQLDPYKQFFRQSYTLTYHDQTDPVQIAEPAGFSIDGVNGSGQGVGDVAALLATHPRFALAWVLKLHFWANSTPALEDDPEVLRIAGLFQASKFDFKTLVRELFSSPLVTFASATSTTQTNGVVLSIARRDQFCAALSNRLGLPDVCGMQTPKPTSQQVTIAGRAELMPVDTYYRAYALPSLPTNPDLFFRDSTESICRLVADQLVDVKTPPSRYSSLKPADAITDFVATVMGLVSSDPRAAQAQAILTDNFAASQKTTGVSATDALKATFTLACIAPSSVIVGL